MSQMNSTNETKSPSGGRKAKNDVIFITAVLIFLSLVGLAFYFLREEGDVVTVEVNGATYGVYALSEDRVVEIRTGDGGEELNRLVISGGEAFVELATCPDGICANHKPISREGESIVCLPHRVVVTVHKTSDQNAPDIVV